MDATYFFLSRPPGIGCQPAGYTRLEARIPKRFSPELPRGDFGTVTYPTPLPLHLVWKYDLFPAALLDRVVYLAWRECDRDRERADRYLQAYFELAPAELERYAEEFLVSEVSRLREAGLTLADAQARLKLMA